MGNYLLTTVEEIEQVCSYIKNDYSVARYFGISVERVKHVRANIKQPAETRRFKTSRTEGGNASSGYESHLAERVAATLASCQLKGGIEALFRKVADAHSISADEARQLMLDTGMRRA